MTAAALLEQIARQSVLVIGDVVLDRYLQGEAARICREAPVPVVALTDSHTHAGGAANTAANTAALGAKTTLLSVWGEDSDGHALSDLLLDLGVGTFACDLSADRRTIVKQRVSAVGQVLLRVDDGTTTPLDLWSERRLVERLYELYRQHTTVIVADYGYGVITDGVIKAIEHCQKRWPRCLVIDSRLRLPEFRHLRPIAVKPNCQETAALLNLPALVSMRNRARFVERYGDNLLDRSGARIVAVTLDTEGGVIFERGQSPRRLFAQARPQKCAAGAGDTFTAVFALALAAGASGASAGELASTAAARVVNKEGTAICTAGELRERGTAGPKYICDLDALESITSRLRAQGRSIVFTNGCFDILHRGHIALLNRAKSLGSVLIVALNDDEGVRRLKGPGRPINTLEDRIRVLDGLSFVDHVTSFSDDTSCKLIRRIRPDVFVKGGDYRRDEIPEAALVEELGGVVQILPYEPNYSTTAILQRAAIRAGRAVAQSEGNTA